MKKILSFSLAILIVFSHLFSIFALSVASGTETDLVLKINPRFYTVKDSVTATTFGISPNAKGTKYYVDPKQSDNETVFGNSTSDKNTSSYSLTNVAVADNENFTTAKKFIIKDTQAFNNATFNSVNIYQGKPTALQEWTKVPYADMRFWIKTSCEFTVTFSLMSHAGTSVYPHITRKLTIPAGDGWQEIRITRDDFSDSSLFDKQVTEDLGTLYFRFMATNDLLPVGETVYISQPRFNNGTLDVSTLKNKYIDYSHYYNNFQTYSVLDVTDESYYSGTYNYNNEFRVSTPSATDISEYITDGQVRFWVNVPKDMKIRFGFSSYTTGDGGGYGRVFCTKELKVADNDPEGFQEVVIPLSDFNENRESKFSWQHINFFAIKGINNCDAETFIGLDEVVKISPIEIWSGKSPAAKPAYTYVPKYYSTNNKATVVDLNVTMDKRTQINAFSIKDIPEEYQRFSDDYQNNTSLLDVCSVTAVIAGAEAVENSKGAYEQYAVAKVRTEMNVLFPVNEQLTAAASDNALSVFVAGKNGVNKKTYDITDEYLVVNTDELGDFLFVAENTPIFTASVSSPKSVYDNTIIKKGTSIVRSGGGYRAFVSYGATKANEIFNTVKGWLDAKNGQMSFWIKIPWQEGTPTVTRHIDLSFTGKIKDKVSYPHQHAKFDVTADGLWHEIRVNSKDFIIDTAGKDDFTTITDISSFYVRINNGNADNETYWFGSDVKFFESPIETAIPEGEGNIELEQTAAIDTANGGGATGISHKMVKIADNRFERVAMKYYDANVDTYNFTGNAFPFNVASPTGNELKEFLTHRGDIRTYIKNVSDHDMTFRVGIKISHNAGGSGYAEWMKNITVEGDGQWHEIRISYNDLGFNTSSNAYKALMGIDGYKFYSMWFYISGLNKTATASGAFTSSDDQLYFTPPRIYNRNIIEPKSTDFSREYKQSILMKKYGNWKKDDATVTHSNNTYSGECLPFFTNVVTYKHNPSGDIKTLGKQTGLLSYGKNTNAVTGEAFADWYYNDNAELRLWVKSSKNTEFNLGVYITGGEIITTHPIRVSGSSEWQEIIIKRSDFAEWNTGMEKSISGNTFEPILFLRANEKTFSDTTELHIAQMAEFYSDKAYAKGDANRDNSVDVIDLIRLKKQATQTFTNITNYDINNNGTIEALDLGLLRKKLLNGKW